MPSKVRTSENKAVSSFEELTIYTGRDRQIQLNFSEQWNRCQMKKKLATETLRKEMPNCFGTCEWTPQSDFYSET